MHCLKCINSSFYHHEFYLRQYFPSLIKMIRYSSGKFFNIAKRSFVVSQVRCFSESDQTSNIHIKTRNTKNGVNNRALCCLWISSWVTLEESRRDQQKRHERMLQCQLNLRKTRGPTRVRLPSCVCVLRWQSWNTAADQFKASLSNKISSTQILHTKEFLLLWFSAVESNRRNTKL